MSKQNPKSGEHLRIRQGQSSARGATGDGDTGVPAGEQGMSNRPGDVDVVPDEDDAAEGQGEALEDEESEDESDEDDEDEDEGKGTQEAAE